MPSRLLLAAALALATTSPARAATRIVRAADVEWQHLNPARGAKSPAAGTLWGDRNGTVATGYLLRPVDGFQSPPHIHNVSYRGVVIRGALHNADPAAPEQWMATGSFWTQPKGAVHITSAKGTDTLAYIEIEEGPYLVRPPARAFPTNEEPVNVDSTNIVWVDPASVSWGPDRPAGTTQVAFLWGEPGRAGPCGMFLRVAGGSAATISGAGSPFRAVVVRGTPRVAVGEAEGAALEPGSLLEADGETAYRVRCEADRGCVFYVRREGGFRVE